MSLRQIAENFREWAKSHKMLSVNSPSIAQDAGRTDELFQPAGIVAAIETLQNRRVSFIGIDEAENRIVIFTEKRLSKKEQKMLEKATLTEASSVEQITLKFVYSGSATSGAPPSAPAVPPFILYNGRYPCGTSISIASEKSAGTFGCLVRNSAGRLFGLSNNHVIAGCNYAPIDTPILAPGVIDVTPGQVDPFTIGIHSACYPFVDGIPPIVNATENLDAALFEIRDPDKVSSMQRDAFDTPDSVMPMQVGMTVRKIGRTTGISVGTVVSKSSGLDPITYNIASINGLKVAFFSELYMIQASAGSFCTFGDSGAVVTTQDTAGNRHLVGLIVGVTAQGLGIAHCITRVFQYFDVTPVSNHNA